MCTVSMIGDHYGDKWFPQPQNPDRGFQPFDPAKRAGREDIVKILTGNPVTREEFDKLKAEVAEMTQLLKRALEYDRKNNEPDCQMEEKMVLLRKVCDAVGINLDEILNK